jgi:hypothetical protein
MNLREIGNTLVLLAIVLPIAQACTGRDVLIMANPHHYQRQVTNDLLNRYGVVVELQSCTMGENKIEGSCSFKATLEQIELAVKQLELEPIHITSRAQQSPDRSLRFKKLQQTSCWAELQSNPAQKLAAYALYDDENHQKKQLWGGDKTALGKGVALQSIELLYSQTDDVGCFRLSYHYGAIGD